MDFRRKTKRTLKKAQFFNLEPTKLHSIITELGLENNVPKHGLDDQLSMDMAKAITEYVNDNCKDQCLFTE